MNIMSAISNKLFKLYSFIASCGLVLTIIFGFLRVIFRQIPYNPPPFASEFAVSSFIWLVMAGAAVHIRTEKHVKVDYFFKKIPSNFKKYLKISFQILILILACIIFIYSFKFIETSYSDRSTVFGFRRWTIYYVQAPVGFFGIIFFTVENIINSFKNLI